MSHQGFFVAGLALLWFPSEGIVTRDLSSDAHPINQPGVTLVPREVYSAGGDVVLRAKDARCASPGPDEAQ